MPVILEVDGLVRRPPHQGGAISFRLGPGEVMGVIGPHNSGKSQLLSALAGLQKPVRGSVKICGSPLSRQSLVHVGYVPPHPGLFGEMTCREYLEFFARSFNVPSHYAPYLIQEALERTELEFVGDRPIEDLTMENRIRLSIARGIVHDPSLLVVNNVLERLDPHQARELVTVLQKVRERGKALVVSSPSLSELASICSHLCILVTDRPLACGELSALMPQLANLKMMQVQFLQKFDLALKFLERHPSVFHLSVSTHTHNLVRFLFDGQKQKFEQLLDQLQNQGCLIVSVAEDHSFLGRMGSI